MPTVDLIYARDCPNIVRTRANLLRAFAESGLEARWLEWERDDAATPEDLRRYGSPTLLVNQRDIAGDSLSGAASCRLYRDDTGRSAGVPPTALIKAALLNAANPSTGTVRRERFRWRSSLAGLPGVGAALLPVGTCPACFAAYAGVLGSLGVTSLLQTQIVLPVLSIGLLLALVALGYRAKTRRGYAPVVIGAVAAALILTGKFWEPSAWLEYGGIALLVAASVWNAWPHKPKRDGKCPACLPATHSQM